MNLTNEQILEELENVIDPELGIDIVNLGLVYNVEQSGKLVKVTMTMTSMGCPMAGHIIADVKETLLYSFSEHLEEVDVEIVWTPVWTKDRMSRIAKIGLGIHG